MHNEFTEVLHNFGTRVFVKKNESIYDSMKALSVPYAYYLVKGICALTSYSKDGKENIFLYFKEDRIIGFSQLLNQQYLQKNYYLEFSIIAKTDCTLYRIPEKEFLRLLDENPYFNNLLINTLNCNYYDVLSKYAQSLEESATVKICRLLITQSVVNDGIQILPKFFTYMEMSKYLGTHSVTVARVMSKLKQLGYIYKDRDSIVIKDLSQLERLINENLDLDY